jgi:hypothetical protein
VNDPLEFMEVFAERIAPAFAGRLP